MLNEQFERMFFESVKFKDWGCLRSSLNMREKATQSVQGDAGYYAIGKANEATLLGHHIGDGLRAYAATKEALKDIDALARMDENRKSVTGYSILLDCLGFVINWSNSFEEAIDYCTQLTERTDAPNAGLQLKQLKDFQSKGQPWWSIQLLAAHNFYDRSSPSSDAGKYASAQAILHIILTRALEEKPKLGYETVPEEKMYDMLDDYVWLSLRSYALAFEKFRTALAQGAPIHNVNGDAEQYIIFEDPLKCWLELMPDMPLKWKSAFEVHYEIIMRSPFPIFPEIMGKIGAFFPDVRIETITCQHCGNTNSSLSPHCIKCGRSFKSGKLFTEEKEYKRAVKNNSQKNPGCLVGVILLLGILGSLIWWLVENVF